MVGRASRLVLLLAFVVAAACTAAPPPTASTPPGMFVLELTARSSAFDVDRLSVASGVPFAVRLRNEDRDVHNFELRDDAGARIFVGELFRGPGERLDVIPALAAGRYVFLCTAHPFMKGDLLAE